MTPRAAVVVVWALLLLTAATVSAQTNVDGSAEWTVAKSSNQSNGDTSKSDSFWQNYSVRYASALWDPRLARINTEGLFRTSTLTSSGTSQTSQKGQQNDLGYRLGGSFLPASAFPFFIQASHVTTGSTGDLAPITSVRSVMTSPVGAPPLDVQTLNKSFNIGGKLVLPNLPRVELNYRRDSATATGGGYQSDQKNGDLSAAVYQDTPRTRQSFRYSNTSSENSLGQTFVQRQGALDYDLSVTLTEHTRLIAHGGRRNSFSRSEFAPVVDQGAAYVPPAIQGSANTDYALGGISYEPSPRFSFQFTGNVDRQTAETATTSAKLINATSRFELFRGLSLIASGTSGTRGQKLSNTPITVKTQSGIVGATYQAGPRWLNGTATITNGIGTNTTPDGLKGSTTSWSREASLSSALGWLGLGAGYSREQRRDAILDYGNFDSERTRASIETQARRAGISTTFEQLHITRGHGLTYAHNAQKTLSTTGSLRLMRDASVSVTAGTFVNDFFSSTQGAGRDHSLFWGGTTQFSIRQALRVSLGVRSEMASATKSGFTQQAVSTVGRVEYRLRSISVALEYRNNDGRVRYADTSNLDKIAGQQLRVSVARQFAFGRR